MRLLKAFLATLCIFLSAFRVTGAPSQLAWPNPTVQTALQVSPAVKAGLPSTRLSREFAPVSINRDPSEVQEGESQAHLAKAVAAMLPQRTVPPEHSTAELAGDRKGMV